MPCWDDNRKLAKNATTTPGIEFSFPKWKVQAVVLSSDLARLLIEEWLHGSPYRLAYANNFIGPLIEDGIGNRSARFWKISLYSHRKILDHLAHKSCVSG